MSKSESSSGGIGFGGMLQILFIGLKLTGHISWPWVWVFAPTWIGLLLVLVVVVVLVVGSR